MERKQKVVVFQSNPQGVDLSYEEIEAEWRYRLDQCEEIGEYRIIPKHSRITAKDYIEELKDADAVMGPIVHPDFVNETLFSLHPSLKYVATLDHGYEAFDTGITRKYGVTVTNTIYGDRAVAQFAMALLLQICHDVPGHDRYIKGQYWEDRKKDPHMEYEHLLCPQIELDQKILGIIGPGNIGRRMAQMAAGFGMRVIAYSRTKTGSDSDFEKYVSLEELLETSDVISVHCPLTKETEKLLNREAFSKMKQGVILINTARGAVIDEEALLDALNERKVYMAGLDVIAEEPPQYKIPLMESPYTYITPHIAWQSKDARLRAVRLAVENYISYLHGEVKSRIN